MRRFLLLLPLLLCGCEPKTASENPPLIVARICRDGSHIFKYPDGSYHTAYGYLVEEIDKVCES